MGNKQSKPFSVKEKEKDKHKDLDREKDKVKENPFIQKQNSKDN
jgi:hypothetical protein